MGLVPAADPFVGRSLAGRYRVDKKLGEGGMGAVYAGEHLLIQRPVAIKVLHPQLATNGDLVRRFLNEARAVTAIRHEHIVDVTDMGQLDDGTLFMVLELLDGWDFAGLIQKERALPVPRVIHIVDQMCVALEVAHARGIVHRDLKPENVFLIRRGDDPDFVKILDFGIAKILGGDGSGARTQTGTAMGTLHYMSPEQVQGGRDLDHRTDIYALGVILFRALGGRFPFDGDTLASLLSKILLDPVPELRTIRPDAPAALEAIVSRCLAKRADDRFASCAELRVALNGLLSGSVQELAPAPHRRSDSFAYAATAAISSSERAAIGPPPSGSAEAQHASQPIEAPRRERSRRASMVAIGIGALAIAAIGVGAGVYAGAPEAAPSESPVRAALEPLEPQPLERVREPEPRERALEPEPVVEPEPEIEISQVERDHLPEPIDGVALEAARSHPDPIEAAAPAAPARRPRPTPRDTRAALHPTPQPLAPAPTPSAPAPLPPAGRLGDLGQGSVRRIP